MSVLEMLRKLKSLFRSRRHRDREFTIVVMETNDAFCSFRRQANGRVLAEHLFEIDCTHVEDYVISCSGKIINPFEFKPARKQKIVLVPQVGHPVVAGIVGIVAGVAAGIGAAGIIAMSATLITVLRVVSAVGILISIFAAKKPKAPTYGAPGGGVSHVGSGSFSNSPTYAWTGIQTIADPSAPVAVVCGEHRFGGNMINCFVSGHKARDKKWKTIGTSNVSASGTVCSFRTSSAVDGLWLTLRRYRLLWDSKVDQRAGLVGMNASPGFVQPMKGKFRNSGTGEYVLAYKIEVKKAAHGDYTGYHPIYLAPPPGGKVEIVSLRTVSGTTVDLDLTWWDIRITGFGFHGIPQGINYCKHLKGRTSEAAPDEPDDNYLNLLLGLGEGPIDSVSDIQVNGVRIEDFVETHRGPDIHVRHGHNTQPVVPGFHELHYNYGQSRQIDYGSPVEYTTTRTDVEAIELELTMNGIYATNVESGEITSWTVQYKIEIRKVSVGSWTNLGTYSISGKTMNRMRRFFRKEGLGADQYVIRVSRVTADPDFYHIGVLLLTNVNEIRKEAYCYPNTALLGIRLLASERISGGMPNINCIVRGRLWNMPKITLAADSSVELQYDEYYHDGTDYRRLSDGGLAEWDGFTWMERWTANPVWIFYGMCVNDVFGLGEVINVDNIDRDALEPLAAYCDELVEIGDGKGCEKRFRLDVVIDAPSRGLDLMMELASTFRGMPFWSEGTINLAIDRPGMPVQLFSHGNIVQNSMRETWAPLKSVGNLVEVQFLDAAKDFEHDTVEIADEAAILAGEPVRRKTNPMYGIVRRSQSTRMARYLLLVEKHCKMMIAFRVGIDSLSAQCADLISVQHSISEWGTTGGRLVLQCSATRLLPEVPVTLGTGTYSVAIRLPSGALETRVLDESSGTFDILHVSVPFSVAPTEYSPFLIGPSSEVCKTLRLVGLVRTSDLEIDLAAVEYSALVYADGGDPLGQVEVQRDEQAIRSVVNLSAAANSYAVSGGGSTSQGVEVTWESYYPHGCEDEQRTLEQPVAPLARLGQAVADRVCRVSVAKHSSAPSAATEYEEVGITTGRQFRIADLPAGTYRVAVQASNARGEFQSIDEAETVDVIVAGLSAIPPNVSNFGASWSDSSTLVFSWDNLSQDLVAGYEIRKNNTDWGTADSNRIFSGVSTQFIYKDAPQVSTWYYIRAFNAGGTYSPASAFLGSGAAPSAEDWIKETPSGVIDGVNDTFTISSTPDGDTFELFHNGGYKLDGTHYDRTGTTIVYTAGNIPQGGDWHYCHYLKPPA